jgi:hypothetical protein
VALLEGGGFGEVVVAWTFGLFGELAFEINSLAWKIRKLDKAVRLLTLPLVLPVGILDVAFPPGRGNSLMAQCTKSKS